MMPTRADRAAPGDLAVTDEYVDPWPLALHELRALRDDEGVAPEEPIHSATRSTPPSSGGAGSSSASSPRPPLPSPGT
jgi:hypothetical protein